ncbi:hypothetical protein DPMN_015922 [Dreissena polymorpha]|uniref:nitric-oxide synthase (NADPH) n=1 Tax=Dreissena polymorpha TaxID=45954 RepID=A0A9D4NDS1_DREPO|nr:hypothetical protein DPMN_015922 [Dreissena polymorpha]
MAGAPSTYTFGCRNIAMDAIYRDEMQQMKADGVLKEVYTALSREPNVPKVTSRGGAFVVNGQQTGQVQFLNVLPSQG